MWSALHSTRPSLSLIPLSSPRCGPMRRGSEREGGREGGSETCARGCVESALAGGSSASAAAAASAIARSPFDSDLSCSICRALVVSVMRTEHVLARTCTHAHARTNAGRQAYTQE